MKKKEETREQKSKKMCKINGYSMYYSDGNITNDYGVVVHVKEAVASEENVVTNWFSKSAKHSSTMRQTKI